MSPRLRAALPAAAFVLCTLVWGSTWLVIKIGYDTVPPLNAAGWRFLVSSAVLLAIQGVARVPAPRGGVQWGVAAFVGIVLVGLDYGLIYWGEQFLETGLTSVLFATMPLFTLLLAAALRLERITLRKTLGIAAAIGGVIVLCHENLGLERVSAGPVAAVLGAAVCSAATTTVTKKWGSGLHPVSLNAASCAIGCAALFGGALAAGEGIVVPRGAGWIPIAYLALFGSVLAFLLYFWLLRQWDATRCGLVSVLTPILAVALGVAVRGEALTTELAAGAALVLAGVFVAMRSAPPTRST